MLAKIGRIAMIATAVTALSGCWFSEADMFDPSEFADVGLEGEYTSEIDYDDREEVFSVRFTPEEDGRYRMDVEVAFLDEPRGEVTSTKMETMRLSFVSIPDGPENWYLLQGFDKPEQSQTGHLIAHMNNGRVLELYMPNCKGTPERNGMTSDMSPPTKVGRCDFQDKQALMDAGAEAANFLAQPQIVLITPFMAYKPKRN